MADPFSIIAVTDIGLRTAETLTGFITRLRDAPEELLALSNEVWTLNIVLEDVQELERSPSDARARKMDTTRALVYQARMKLDLLNTMTTQWGRLSPWGDSFTMRKRDKLLWLKEKGCVVRLQTELRKLRNNLSVAMGTGTTSAVARMEVNILALMSQLVKLNVETGKQSAVAPPDGSSPAGMMNRIYRNQDEMKGPLQDTTQNTLSTTTGGTIDARFDRRTQLERPDCESAKSAELSPTLVGGNVETESNLPLFMSLTRGAGGLRTCPPECQCTCHLQTFWKTPKYLQQIVGYLLLGYSGHHPMQQEQCISSCLRKQSRPTHVTYFFPRWFVSRAISFSISNAVHTPTLDIKLRRVVPESSQLFSLSRFGDVQGVKTLFDNGLASPYDIHFRGGWTALHFAVDYGCLELCRLLLDCGADPNWEDATGITPVEKACRNVLHLRAPMHLRDSLSVLFPSKDFIQERRFTRLHRLVIGLDMGSMEEELIESPQSIHALDIDGWTPLHWAARRGNYNAMCLLLQSGADPQHVTEDEKRNALHLAAQRNSLCCVQKLLKRQGNFILDINGVDGYGYIPLMVSASHNCADTTATLIEHGADLNASDHSGETALFTAVDENAHESIVQLLDAGVDYTLKTRLGSTILHWAANESDLQTLRLLTKARMRGVDVDARNADGQTATDLFVARHGSDQVYITAFEELMTSVRYEEDENDKVESLESDTSGAESWRSFEDCV